MWVQGVCMERHGVCIWCVCVVGVWCVYMVCVCVVCACSGDVARVGAGCVYGGVWCACVCGEGMVCVAADMA